MKNNGGWGVLLPSVQKFVNGSAKSFASMKYEPGQTFGLEMDFDARTVEVFIDNVSVGIGHTSLSMHTSMARCVH